MKNNDCWPSRYVKVEPEEQVEEIVEEKDVIGNRTSGGCRQEHCR